MHIAYLGARVELVFRKESRRENGVRSAAEQLRVLKQAISYAICFVAPCHLLILEQLRKLVLIFIVDLAHDIFAFLIAFRALFGVEPLDIM